MKRYILIQTFMLFIILSGIIMFGDGEIKGEDSIEVVWESEITQEWQF